MMEFWPQSLVPANINFRIKPMNSFGPRTFSGKQQTVSTDAGFWVADLSGFPVLSDAAILEWRGTIGSLEGSANDLVIGPYDYLRAPAPHGYSPQISGIPHSDGSYFSDGAGYRQSTIKVRAAASAKLRATTLTLAVEQAGPIKKGMYFTVWSEVSGVIVPRMYMVTRPPEVDGSRVEIQFRPPLRQAVDRNDEVDFADPKLLMNLSDQDAGSLDLEYGRFARPSLLLEESWNGLS